MNTVGAGEGRWEWNKTRYLFVVVGWEPLAGVGAKKKAIRAKRVMHGGWMK